jgi:hypothetical protein
MDDSGGVKCILFPDSTIQGAFIPLGSNSAQDNELGHMIMLHFEEPQYSVARDAGMSRRLLWDIACWALSEQQVAVFFPQQSAARLKQARLKLNRDLVRITMIVLSLDAMEGQAEAFSIRKLARVLDRPREESMQRTLRNWLLPLLTEVQWIEGFVVTSDWSSSPHEITITSTGLKAVEDYFTRVKQATGAQS